MILKVKTLATEFDLIESARHFGQSEVFINTNYIKMFVKGKYANTTLINLDNDKLTIDIPIEVVIAAIKGANIDLAETLYNAS